MKIRCILIVALTITLLAACQPGETQPVHISVWQGNPHTAFHGQAESGGDTSWSHPYF
jgi:hypothetical protein